MKKNIALIFALLLAANSAFSQALQPQPNQPKVGDLIVAIKDESQVKSNRDGWYVAIGEVYQFQGFAKDGLAVLKIGGLLVNAHVENFAPIQDMAAAALKYADEVRDIQKDNSGERIATQDTTSQDSAPELTATVTQNTNIDGTAFKAGDVVQLARIPQKTAFNAEVVTKFRTIRFPMEYLHVNDPQKGDAAGGQQVAYCRAQGWQERMGGWRGPDGQVYSAGTQMDFTGPVRLHRRAVDDQIEAMICQRDTAIATGQTGATEADANFNSQLAAMRQAQQLAAIQSSTDDANRKIDDQNRKMEELQRRLNTNF